MRQIRRLIKIIKWMWNGCHFIYYEHYMCGACGRGWHVPFFVPMFDSLGEWWDTVGVCPEGTGCPEYRFGGLNEKRNI